MEQQSFNEKRIEKSFDLKLFLGLMKYAKPYAWLLSLCILLLMVVSLVDVINPFLIKVAIDDIINTEERIIGSYENYADLTGFTDNGTFYSSMARHYKKPDQLLRVVEDQGAYYLIPSHIKLVEGYAFQHSKNHSYLSNDDTLHTVTVLSEDLSKQLLTYTEVNLRQLALFFFALLVIGFFFNYGQVYLLNWASQKIIYTMREDLFSHIMSLDLKYFEKNPVGRLVTRVTNDLENINEMYTGVLLTVIKDGIMLISIVVIMMSINWKLALVCLLTFPLVVLATVIFRIKIRDVQREVKIKIATINSKLSEYISGMNIIQIFGVEKEYYDDFKASNDDYKASQLDEIKIFGIFRPSMSFIYSTGLVLLLIYGSAKVMSYEIELGVLIAFTSYIKLFYRPIFDFAEKFNIMQSAMASAERLSVINEATNPILDPAVPKRVKKIKGNITFKNVWFAYNHDEWVLKNVNFDIKSGETVAIVGHTGSGKTTITSLINRFYDIQKGDILIDGISIKDIEKKRLRAHIGMVLQDVFLFSATIADNIRLFNTNMSEQRTVEAAEVVNAAPFIERVEGAYDYMLKERGNEFSTGQRQLLSFARALAYNPEIMILDEATSNIDTETEGLIQDAITKLSEKRTTIVIAHRLSTIVNADKIIVLNHGEIAEMGTHNELIQKGGLYYDLYRLQYDKTP